MVSNWVISPTYKWGIPWGYNPLILTFDPNFLPGTSKYAPKNPSPKIQQTSLEIQTTGPQTTKSFAEY